jgi:hypothetical protein
MPLLTYDQVRPWAKAIRGKVISREMPPWGADERWGTFASDLSLTAEEIATLSAWADAGAPKGNDTDLPPAPSFVAGWINGTPDYVFAMPKPYPIPADGELNNLYFWVPVPFKEDRFARLLEFRPGNRSVVHHGTNHVGDLPAGSTLDQSGELTFADGTRENAAGTGRRPAGNNANISLLINYVPGRSALPVRASGIAWRIPAGKHVRFNLHCEPWGRPETDQSRLGVWFSRDREVQELYKMKVGTPLPTAPDQSQFYHVDGAAAPARESDWPPLAPFVERATP